MDTQVITICDYNSSDFHKHGNFSVLPKHCGFVFFGNKL